MTDEPGTMGTSDSFVGYCCICSAQIEDEREAKFVKGHGWFCSDEFCVACYQLLMREEQQK